MELVYRRRTVVSNGYLWQPDTPYTEGVVRINGSGKRELDCKPIPWQETTARSPARQK